MRCISHAVLRISRRCISACVDCNQWKLSMEHLLRMQLAYDLTQARKREKTIKVKRYQRA
jgi:hypothetical protein